MQNLVLEALLEEFGYRALASDLLIARGVPPKGNTVSRLRTAGPYHPIESNKATSSPLVSLVSLVNG